MGIERWTHWSADGSIIASDGGEYVRFTDHEQVVADLEQRVIVAEDFCVERDREITRLRAELAAKSKEVEALRDGLEAVYQYGSDTLRGPTGETLDDRAWQRQAVLEMTNRASRTIDSGSWKGEGNGR